MYNKPITQRVAFARGKKPSALKQTEDTTVLNKEQIPVVVDKKTTKLPDTVETQTIKGDLIPKEKSKNRVKKGTPEYEQYVREKKRCSQLTNEQKLDPKNKCTGFAQKREADKEVEVVVPGGEATVEAPQYMYDTGDAMPAWMQRSVERGLSQSARKTGKFASKLAKDQKKLAKLKEAGKTDSPKYAKLKARVGAREGALTAQKLFAETQMEAARQGKSPGSKNIVNIGTFNPNVRVNEVDDATRRTTVGRQKTLADVSPSTQELENQKKLQNDAENEAKIDAAKNQDAVNKRNAQDESGENKDVKSAAEMRVGPLKMKSSFKMGGFGSKTYKK